MVTKSEKFKKWLEKDQAAAYKFVKRREKWVIFELIFFLAFLGLIAYIIYLLAKD